MKLQEASALLQSLVSFHKDGGELIRGVWLVNCSCCGLQASCGLVGSNKKNVSVFVQCADQDFSEQYGSNSAKFKRLVLQMLRHTRYGSSF